MKERIRQTMKRLVPEQYQKPLKWVILRLIWFGREYQCNVCQSSVRKFKPIGYDFSVLKKYRIVGSGLRNTLCPVCGSSERIRLLLYFLQTHTSLFKEPVKLLHIAPEPSLEYFFRKTGTIDYLTADLRPEDVMMQLDITSIPLPDHSFDVIICNHVMEHISQDGMAMEELFRVLKPNGWAILQVPVSLELKETYEDFAITGEKEREKAFGQKDHVRIYGQDYTDRLKKAGFKVLEYQWTQNSSLLDFGLKLRLNKEEVIYYCTK